MIMSASSSSGEMSGNEVAPLMVPWNSLVRGGFGFVQLWKVAAENASAEWQRAAAPPTATNRCISDVFVIIFWSDGAAQAGEAILLVESWNVEHARDAIFLYVEEISYGTLLGRYSYDVGVPTPT